MTRLRKRGNHPRLLLLTVLTLVKTCWTNDGRTPRKLSGSSNELDIIIGTSVDPESLQYHLTRWNETVDSSGIEDNASYYGEGLPDILFHSENDSLILTDFSRCLYDFQFVTCLKLLLVNRLDNLLDYMKDKNLTTTDLSFMNGIVNFKIVPGVNHFEENRQVLDLDEDISQKMMELFKDRSLEVNILPGVRMDLAPVPMGKDFVGFKARPYLKWWFWRNDAEESEESGRKKKGGFKMPSMMILPQLIMWGLMPFALANLQAMVMNAFMLNMMALNSAIFMTIRNLVFGPRGGPKIKYVNYGYRKKKKSTVPTLIVHSPAAFVKQPFHHRKRPNWHRPPVKLHPHPTFHHQLHHEPIFHESSDFHSGSVEIHQRPIFHRHVHYEPNHHDSSISHSDAVEQQQRPTFHHPVRQEPSSNDYPTSHSDLRQSVKEGNYWNEYGSTAGGSNNDYHLDAEELPITNGIRVLKENGRLDGKNRVRIKITPEGPTVREVLHRVRDIEEKYKIHGPENGNKLVREVPYRHSQDDTPWTVSGDATSHGDSDTHASQVVYNSESDENVMNYNQNEFMPMINYPKNVVRH